MEKINKRKVYSCLWRPSHSSSNFTKQPQFTILKKKKFFSSISTKLITLLKNHSRRMLFDTWKHIWYLINLTEKLPASHVEKKIKQNILYPIVSLYLLHLLDNFNCQPSKCSEKVACSRVKSTCPGWLKDFLKCWVCHRSFPILAIIMPVQPCFKSKMRDARGSTYYLQVFSNTWKFLYHLLSSIEQYFFTVLTYTKLFFSHSLDYNTEID